MTDALNSIIYALIVRRRCPDFTPALWANMQASLDGQAWEYGRYALPYWAYVLYDRSLVIGRNLRSALLGEK